MSEHVVFDPGVLDKAIGDVRWTAMARAQIDLGTIGTWDPFLPREHRILVPVDVQAFVVPRQGGERTVPLTGGNGDPAPFADGARRPPGVHLHWAMPDALLEATSEGEGTDAEPVFPPLPDRWVVLRVLRPIGGTQVLVTGWVIDAPSGVVVPLADYTGTVTVPTGVDVFEPFDGAVGGSLLWTASYEASRNRFALHDPLDDLDALKPSAPQGFDANRASYVVAGWFTDPDDDPLAAARSTAALDAALAALGWFVTHDTTGQDTYEPLTGETPLGMPVAFPSTPPAVVRDGITGAVTNIADVSLLTGVPSTDVGSIIVAPDEPRHSSLLHGAVLGVPLDGSVAADDRPEPVDTGVAIGIDTDDVVAALAAPSLGLGADARGAAEQLVAAFTGELLDRLHTPDGLDDLDDREHRDGFWSVTGAPLPLARPDRLRAEDTIALGPLAVGRAGRSAAASAPPDVVTELAWSTTRGLLSGGPAGQTRGAPLAQSGPTKATVPSGRTVTKPPPRLFRPRPPMVAVRGARPNHRHHGDGLFDDEGRLQCRYATECVTEIEGTVDGASVLPSLRSGAVPGEVLTVAREAVVLDPYGTSWLAAAGARATAGTVFEAYETRVVGEIALLYGANATYDGTSHVTSSATTPAPGTASSWAAVSKGAAAVDRQILAELSYHSLLVGSVPSPIALTTWRQPWVPLWLEWDVTLAGSDTTDGWTLRDGDLERDGPPKPPSIVRRLVGRSPIGQGASEALQQGIAAWLGAEATRDAAGTGLLDPDEQDLLDRLGDFVGPIDLVSASLDGIAEQLLGIGYVGVLARDGDDELPVADGLPVPLFGGTLRVEALRLVDAFGRTLTLPATGVVTTETLSVDGASMLLRPRFQHGARWLLRLVDPAYAAELDAALAPEAFVDQIAPELAVNPVSGFLLPDHIDEALEVFSVAGEALGQLGHDAVSGAVLWEPAPGRPVPPDAGPLAGLGAHERIVGELAAGLVVADIAGREAQGPTDSVTRETSLTALLRAVDTTLWTVDTYAAVGSPTVSGLVGRPIAVVRATLRLHVPDDVDEVVVTEAGGPGARAAAFRAVDEQRIAVRLGTLGRSDDALLGFFVDDDYRHLRVVDKAVAASAIVSGRHVGHLGQLGEVIAPPTSPIVHPYLVADDLVWLRPGQVVRLTLLMLPAGRVHLTTGVLPRKELALADDWVTPGLRKISPSVRVGPVLVDPSEIRLPLISTLGERQTFTRRTGPLTWRDDPILAATQTAYLPTIPHEAQEGWVRVLPVEEGTT